MRICGSTINALTVSGSGGLVRIGGDPYLDTADCAGNTIAGAVNLTNNVHGLDVIDNRTSGGITINGNALSSEFLDVLQPHHRLHGRLGRRR